MADAFTADPRKVVKGFIKSGDPRARSIANLNLTEENFKNLTLRLKDCKWAIETIKADGFVLKKEVKTTCGEKRGNVITTVTASSEAPNSYINIVFGAMKGVPFDMAKCDLEYGETKVFKIDISKDHQAIAVEPGSTQEVIIGSGKVSMKSTPNVHQGTFEAKATLSGPVMFPLPNGQTMQFNIEAMAMKANATGHLSKPFTFENDELCWHVVGNVDLLVESLTLTSR